jgi:DUF4097 and DUF4098 domain-containing protein YvlB
MLSAFALSGCTKNYLTNTNPVTESFSNINIDSDTADIEIVRSEDGDCKVVCFEHEKAKHTVTVQDNTLNIRLNDNRKWYERIIGNSHDKVTVYLPDTEYSDLTIKSDTSNVDVLSAFKFNSVSVALSTGDVTLLGVTCQGEIKVKVSTGDVKLIDVSCQKFTSTGNTGDITLKGVVAEEEFSITRSTGNVKLYECAANDKIYLKTSTGKINFINENLTVMENAEITVKVSTGGVHLKNIKCKNLVSTGSTGDITLTSVIAVEKFDIIRDTGDVKFNDCDATEISVETSTGDIKGNILSKASIDYDTSTGSVRLDVGGIQIKN